VPIVDFMLSVIRFCRPLSRVDGFWFISTLGFRYAPPQALCYRLLRRLGVASLNGLIHGRDARATLALFFIPSQT